MARKPMLEDYRTWETASTYGEYPSVFHICPLCGTMCTWRSTELHIEYHKKECVHIVDAFIGAFIGIKEEGK